MTASPVTEDDVAPECPACLGEHEPTEVSGPPDRMGRCEMFFVCECCGERLSGTTGWDSVL